MQAVHSNCTRGTCTATCTMTHTRHVSCHHTIVVNVHWGFCRAGSRLVIGVSVCPMAYDCIYPARACASKGLCDRSWCLYNNNYPARACASKGLCDRSWCLYIYKLYIVVCKKNFELFPIFENTHFQTPTSTQKLSSSNLIASYTP